MATYYASAAVSSGGAGTIGDPWPLRTALANASQTAGDTLYLRGGTYTGRFKSTLTGGTVRPYPGESVKFDGNKTTTLSGDIASGTGTINVGSTEGMFGGLVVTIDDEDIQVASVVDADTFTAVRGWNGTAAAAHTAGATVTHNDSYILNILGGDNTTYRDLEIYSSSTFRDVAANRVASGRGSGIVITGASDGNFLINNIIHDCANGIFIGSDSSNTTVYGNVVYNNGIMDGPGDPAGQGIYAENASGYSRVYRNVIANNYNGNGQFGGDSGPYIGGDHQYNVFANSGAPAGTLEVNYLGRAEGQALSVTNNHFFQHHNNSGGSASLFGYGEAMSALTLNNNYMVGGVSSCIFSNIDTITGSGNHFFLNDNDFGDAQMFYTLALLPTGTFNNNTYHKAQGRSCFGKQGVGYFGFSTWKTDSGFDANSTETNVNMPDTVVVIPNEYETGRANIVIYATSNPATIDVDLSTTGLLDGQAFSIKNSVDYLGTEVLTGVYDSADPIITITLTDADGVATPTGGSITPATTVPDFAALVVVPGDLSLLSACTISNASFTGVRF